MNEESTYRSTITIRQEFFLRYSERLISQRIIDNILCLETEELPDRAQEVRESVMEEAERFTDAAMERLGLKADRVKSPEEQVGERIYFQRSAIRGALIASGHDGALKFFDETMSLLIVGASAPSGERP